MKKRTVCLLIILILLAGIITFLTRPKENMDYSSDSSSEKAPVRLKETIEKAFSGSRGTYGIVVKNLNTNELYYLEENKIFESGSLYKIWILATAFDQIEKGKLSEDEVLSRDVAALNEKFNISSESAEMTKGKVTLSVKDALTQMIVISHNYAALLLSERIKLSEVRLFLKKHGFKQSSLNGHPETTASEIALFLEKLYKGELAGRESTDKMLALLKKQQLNKGLPKYLPGDVEVAHKTGDIGWFKHDAGIVYTPKGDYVIVILSESNFPEGAQERIAEISKAVYQYFTNGP